MKRRQFLQAILSLSGGVLLETLLSPIYASEVKHPKALSTGFLLRSLQTGKMTGNLSPQYPYSRPGSIMKLVTAAALLEERLLRPTDTYECRGSLTRHHHTYHCQTPHGVLTLSQALGHSCNIYFAQACARLSLPLLGSYLQHFGLADNTTTRHLHGPSQPVALGLHRDIQTTPEQLLELAACIATRGPNPSLDEKTWQVLADGMRLAAREGTAQTLDPKDTLHLAAKTGTTPHGLNFQSWVIGFFPVETPHYVFCAHSQSGTSLDGAIPIARAHLLKDTGP